MNYDAFIPNLLGFKAEQDKPYAELWIGTHPKLASEIEVNDKLISLSDFIKENPIEILGDRVAKKFNNQLPFLFKILSIEKALSIQAHPNKRLAEKLHQSDSENYPDENHKPEIAIVIDKLSAIVGLKPFNEFQQTVKRYGELKILLDESTINNFLNLKSEDEEEIKYFYATIMNAPEEKLTNCIEALIKRFVNNPALTKAEEEFLIQYKNFGADIGLISLLLFNYVELSVDKAFFTDAGIPHAYLKGNIIECMANSDNVVRAGLTPKYKDINTLVDMLEVDSSKSNVEIVKKNNFTFYHTTAEEFEVSSIILSDNYPSVNINSSGVMIFLILEGEVKVNWDENNQEDFLKGESFLIPAILDKFSIQRITDSKLFFVKVP